ncbi:MAG: APC family permease, partial [Actinomycetota bacterium]
YVLTVAVSVTAGVEALVSAAEGLAPFKVLMALGAILFVTLANLRGVKESGTLFAFPTYGFVMMVYLLLVTGFVRCLGGCPPAETAGLHLPQEHALNLILFLKAFSAGTTALTGVEAIADGVQAFRYPQSRNAATTLAAMGALSITMFLGISWLADHTNVVYEHGMSRSVLAQVGFAIFDGGFLFYALQVMTAGILFLAANTAYQDFPRLSSILAQDHFMPHQFINRGDRLVFSNGVLILAGLASILVIAFQANLNSLIQLYLVGVFISFTLSQTGMFLRWRRQKEPGWQRGQVISGFGAIVTGIVFLVIVQSKFTGGAWIITIAIPTLIYLMYSIHKHYLDAAGELAHPQRRPVARRAGQHHMLILVNRVDAATARAVGYARSIRGTEVSAVTFDSASCGAWTRLASEIPISTLTANGSATGSLRRHLKELRADMSKNDFLTVVVPEILGSSSLLEVFRRPGLHRLKASLLFERGVQVLDVPLLRDEIDPGVDQAHEPVRNYVCILVSGVHNATLDAIEYAETLQPTDIRAITFSLDPERTERLGIEWLDSGIPHPLEIEDSPFRDMGRSLAQYVRGLRPDGINRVVTVIIPEFIVKKRRHHILHGQTALLVKRQLLFERGVVVVSVPYHLNPVSKH